MLPAVMMVWSQASKGVSNTVLGYSTVSRYSTTRSSCQEVSSIGMPGREEG